MILLSNWRMVIHCNACIINSKGTPPWLFHALSKTNNDRVEAFFQNKILEDYAKAASLVYDTGSKPSHRAWFDGLSNETKPEFPDGLTVIAPIHVSGIRLGSWSFKEW